VRAGGATDITRIALPTPFAVGDVNAYLVTGERPALVDTGPAFSEAERALEAGLASHGLAVEDLQLVLLTHQHHDHVGLAHRIAERSGAEIACSARLAAYLGDFDGAMDRDDSYSVEMMLRHGVAPEIAQTLQELSRGVRRFGHPARVEIVLEDGDTIVAGDRRLTVALRPGHSPTDTVYLDTADGTAFAGDHLLERISSNPFAHCPIEAGDGPATARATPVPSQLAVYRDSLRRTRALEIGTVLPGHGAPFRGHRAVIDERERLHAERAHAVLGALEGGRTTAAAVSEQLWPQLPATQTYLALSEVLGHLHLLVAAGDVACDDSGATIRFERVS
jgi:glyoxylase-like metal-dependent hydrolase (beta-lactamase superfamily II)